MIRNQIHQHHRYTGKSRHTGTVSPMLFIEQLDCQEQEQKHCRDIIDYACHVENALYKIDKGLINADG